MTDPQPMKSALICTRCWCVVAIDRGKGMVNNEERQPQMCSHLGPAIEVEPVGARDAS